MRNTQWLLQRTLAAAFGLIAPTMNASSSDHLDPAAAVRAKFTLAARNGADVVQASITFQADGLQLLAPGGKVTVNDVELLPERLQKQGYWYKAPLPRAPRYVLQYALAGGQPVRVQEIEDRAFVPDIPATLPRGRGATIVFQGPPPAANERLFVELTGGDGPTRWGFVIRCQLEGNRILLPAEGLAQARLGSARLYVGLTMNEARPQGLAVTRAVGSERTVAITD